MTVGIIIDYAVENYIAITDIDISWLNLAGIKIIWKIIREYNARLSPGRAVVIALEINYYANSRYLSFDGSLLDGSLLDVFSLEYSFRSIFAASIILTSAASVSGQRRVFNPQSGFTHKRSTGISRVARFSKFTMLMVSGTFGECMS